MNVAFRIRVPYLHHKPVATRDRQVVVVPCHISVAAVTPENERSEGVCQHKPPFQDARRETTSRRATIPGVLTYAPVWSKLTLVPPPSSNAPATR